MSSALIGIVSVVIYQVMGTASVVVPSTNCYALDNSSRIYDFSSWIGHPFQYDVQDNDLVLRFCKDVQARSNKGYVNFGRFDKFNYFVAGSGDINFVQEYFNGHLFHCEKSFDNMGRTTQVNIICGNCRNGLCKDGLGCICNVTYDSTCRAFVELAIPCEKPGERVVKGFTVGCHPRSWEIVCNGMTQLGFEKAYNEFSFRTEQTHVTLYMSAPGSLSSLVQKPIIKVFPEKGLKISLSGSAATAAVAPTTLSPTSLIIDWTCERAHYMPYEVQVTVPVENYAPIEFTLAKSCNYRQDLGGDDNRGWAMFGILSCIFIIASTLFCSGWFIYKTRFENQRGLDALPGMTILSACLETVSGGGHSYTRPGDVNSHFVNQASWGQQPGSSQGTKKKPDESRYGSI